MYKQKKIHHNRRASFPVIKALFVGLLIGLAANFIRAILIVTFDLSFEPRGGVCRELFILIAIFIAPISEELAFRLWLIPKRRNIIISILASFILIFRWVLRISGGIDIYGWGMIIIAAVSLFFISFYPTSKLKELVTKKENACIAISSITFMYYHMLSYQFSWTLLLWAPLFFFQILVGGVISAKIRLKHGMIWSIILHSLFNSILLIGRYAMH